MFSYYMRMKRILCSARARQIYLFLITALLLMAMLSPGWALDLEYAGIFKCSFLAGCIDVLRGVLGKFNFHYSEAGEFLKSYIGVLVTVLSLMLSITLGIAERSEKRIFGIRRKELETYEHSIPYKLWRNIAWLSPVYLIICMNLHLCACGYLLLVYSYASLLYLYTKRDRGFNDDKTRELVVNLLIKCFKDQDSPAEWELVRYESYLENIGGDAEKACDWHTREQLYREFVKKLKELRAETAFWLSARFFELVFRRNKNIRDQVSFKIIRAYMRDIWLKGEGIPEEERTFDEMILISMLYTCMVEAEEIHIIDFLEWYLRIDDLSRQLCSLGGRGMPAEVYQYETVLILVFLETWLYENASRDRRMPTCLKKLWAQAEAVLLCNDINIYFRKFSSLFSDKVFTEREDMLSESMNRIASSCCNSGCSIVKMLADSV